MSKLLTIVIPTYNTEEYLPRCIESLIVPRFMDRLEILVIIDGSPDNSLEVARKYEILYPETIKVIDKPNGGHGSAINKGVELATGIYFRVLDSDDWFDTLEFEHYIEKISKIDVDMVLTPVTIEYVFENRKKELAFKNIDFDFIYDANEFDYTNFVLDKLNTMARTTYRTRIIRDSKLILPENTFYVDVLYSLCVMAYVDNFIFIDTNIYHYFIGRADQSVNNYARNIKHLTNVIVCGLNFLNSHYDRVNSNKYLYLAREIQARISQFSTIYFFKLPSNIVNPEIKVLVRCIEKLPDEYIGIFEKELRSFKIYRLIPFLYVLSLKVCNLFKMLFEKKL